MKRFLLLLAFSPFVWSQTIAVTVNGSGSGYTGTSFTSALTSAPATARVCYKVDAYEATNPGFDALGLVGCSLVAPYTIPYNTFFVLPGPHQVVATAYDALGNTVAVSSPAALTNANLWPVNCSGSAPAFTVTPPGSWTGSVSIVAQETGACAADQLVYSFAVDGQSFYSTTITGGAAATAPLDTTRYFNASHIVSVTVIDKTNNVSYVGTPNYTANGANEWSRSVTFANSVVPSDVWNNVYDLRLAAGASFTLGCNVINTDLSAGTVVPCDYVVINSPSIATVNATTGVGTVANPLPVQGTSTQTLTMAETNSSCTDLAATSSVQYAVISTCRPFTVQDIGPPSLMIRITGGTGWTPQLAQICGVSGGVANLCAPGTNTNVNVATSTSSTGGHFSIGPTTSGWILAGGATTVAHFGTDNAIHTSYDPAHSIFVHCGFTSAGLIGAQAPLYTPGIGFDLSVSGVNCLETGLTANIMSTYTATGQATFVSQTNALIATWQASLAYRNFTKPIYTWGDGKNIIGAGADLFASTRTTVPGTPGSSWTTTSAVQYAFQAWASAVHVIGTSMCDECNSAWLGNPLAGPIQPSPTPLAQGSIGSLDVAAGVITLNGQANYGDPGGAYSITGATTAGLNTPNPNIYKNPCGSAGCKTSAVDGHYTAATDPNLIIQQYWNFWPTTTDSLHYDAFAVVREQILAAGAGRSFVSHPNATSTNCQALGNWNGNSTQSIRSVLNISDYTDLYSSHGNEQYLSGRIRLNSVINDQQGMGYTARNTFGCQNSSNPTVYITQGTTGQFGFGVNFPVTITSIANDIITFAAPHGITNIIPGLTRLYITGSSNPAYNVFFYIIAAPTPTTLRVVFARTDFTDTTASGGTLTFNPSTCTSNCALTLCNNGTVPGGNKANGPGASVQITPFGSDHVCYTGTASDVVNQHRGQTFTLSGVTGNASWNTRTFNYGIENLIHATDGNGSASNFIWYREVPTGSATGGSAFIIPDNTEVKGRYGSTQMTDYNEQMPFGMVVECAIVGCAGQRIYKLQLGFQDYMPTAQFASTPGGPAGGWLGQAVGGLVAVFGGTDVNQQLQATPHSENHRAVPMFKALSTGAQELNRWQAYLLGATFLPSPHLGSTMSCGARQATVGSILMCWNASDGPQTRTFNYTPYLQSGQKIIRSNATAHGIKPLVILSAGTASETITLASGEGMFVVFPANYSIELNQPSISVRLADIGSATKVVIRWSYDPYLIDAQTSDIFDCGTGLCQPTWDRGFGQIFYKLIYLKSDNSVLATSDVQIIQ